MLKFLINAAKNVAVWNMIRLVNSPYRLLALIVCSLVIISVVVTAANSISDDQILLNMIILAILLFIAIGTFSLLRRAPLENWGRPDRIPGRLLIILSLFVSRGLNDIIHESASRPYNRRRHPRLHVPAAARIESVTPHPRTGEKANQRTGPVIDLSAFGLALESPYRLRKNELVIVRVNSHDPAIHDEYLAQVRWARTAAADNKTQRYGLQFITGDKIKRYLPPRATRALSPAVHSFTEHRQNRLCTYLAAAYGDSA